MILRAKAISGYGRCTYDTRFFFGALKLWNGRVRKTKRPYKTAMRMLQCVYTILFHCWYLKLLINFWVSSGWNDPKIKRPFCYFSNPNCSRVVWCRFPFLKHVYSHSEARKHDANPTRKGLVVNCEENFSHKTTRTCWEVKQIPNFKINMFRFHV